MIATGPMPTGVSTGAGLGVGKARPALDDAHLGALQQAGDAAREAIDDAVLPRDRAGEIEARRRVDRDAEGVAAACRRAGNVEKFVGGMDQRLRRDAAAQQAGAAGPLAIDQHGVETELAGADRGDIAAGSAADHENARRRVSGIESLLAGDVTSTRPDVGVSR